MLHEVNFPIYSIAAFFWRKKSAERRVLSTRRDTDKQAKGGMSRTRSETASGDWPKPAQAPRLLVNSPWIIQDDALLLQPQ